MKNTIMQWVCIYNNYNYKYTINDLWIIDGDHIVQFICRWAKMNEEFLKEDIQGVIDDLPNILEKALEDNKNQFIKIRVSKSEKLKITENAKFNNMDVSEFIKARSIGE